MVSPLKFVRAGVNCILTLSFVSPIVSVCQYACLYVYISGNERYNSNDKKMRHYPIVTVFQCVCVCYDEHFLRFQFTAVVMDCHVLIYAE